MTRFQYGLCGQKCKKNHGDNENMMIIIEDNQTMKRACHKDNDTDMHPENVWFVRLKT